MASSCDGRYSVIHEWPRLRTSPIDGCEAFESEIRVLAIEGHELQSDGDLALAATSARCEAGRPVRLRLEKGEREIACDRAPQPFPPALGFPQV